jgi:hypothetical protein
LEDITNRFSLDYFYSYTTTEIEGDLDKLNETIVNSPKSQTSTKPQSVKALETFKMPMSKKKIIELVNQTYDQYIQNFHGKVLF